MIIRASPCSTIFFSTACTPAPVAPQNGKISSTNNNEGDSVTYSCLPGYDLVGVVKLTCTSGAWDNTPPTCNAKGWLHLFMTLGLELQCVLKVNAPLFKVKSFGSIF